MKISEKTCVEFVNLLASKSAVPGGGGAAALVGAIGMALGSMVCNLTIGKKKYRKRNISKSRRNRREIIEYD